MTPQKQKKNSKQNLIVRKVKAGGIMCFQKQSELLRNIGATAIVFLPGNQIR